MACCVERRNERQLKYKGNDISSAQRAEYKHGAALATADDSAHSRQQAIQEEDNEYDDEEQLFASLPTVKILEPGKGYKPPPPRRNLFVAAHGTTAIADMTHEATRGAGEQAIEQPSGQAVQRTSQVEQSRGQIEQPPIQDQQAITQTVRLRRRKDRRLPTTKGSDAPAKPTPASDQQERDSTKLPDAISSPDKYRQLAQDSKEQTSSSQAKTTLETTTTDLQTLKHPSLETAEAAQIEVSAKIWTSEESYCTIVPETGAVVINYKHGRSDIRVP